MWEVIAAVIATGVGIVLLPFATSVATNWLDDHRAERKRRRELYEQLVVINARGYSTETAQPRNETRAMLFSLMGPRDSVVREATQLRALTYAARDEENDALRHWVFGHNLAARKLAKKLVSGSTSSQSAPQDPPSADQPTE